MFKSLTAFTAGLFIAGHGFASHYEADKSFEVGFNAMNINARYAQSELGGRPYAELVTPIGYAVAATTQDTHEWFIEISGWPEGGALDDEDASDDCSDLDSASLIRECEDQ